MRGSGCGGMCGWLDRPREPSACSRAPGTTCFGRLIPNHWGRFLAWRTLRSVCSRAMLRPVIAACFFALLTPLQATAGEATEENAPKGDAADQSESESESE